jgi:putative transport protein
VSNQLINNPLLLLFIVASIGYLLGTIKIKGASLGVAAVLFTGMAFGSYNPDYTVPDIVFQLGLILFVYSVGLSSGNAFFRSFNSNGVRDVGFIITSLLISAFITIGIHFVFEFSAATTTGIYAGSSTNTTALAAVSEMIVGNKNVLRSLIEGYTFAYPMGVIGVMIVLKLGESIFNVDYDKEKEILKNQYPIDTILSTRSVKVTNEVAAHKSLRDVTSQFSWNIVFSRLTRGEETSLINYSTVFQMGDGIMMVGSVEDLDEAQQYFGEETQENLYYDRKEYDVQQIFVSNDKMVGQSLASLNLNAKYDAIITRIRRGDAEILAQPDTVLELGDRIRFVARRSDLKELSQMFGDSYYMSSTVNLFSFGLGLGLGLILGSIEFKMGDNLSFKLGLAGGPLVVGIILGALRRTGPIAWSLPYSANVTLRQLGLTMLLAVVGLQSGHGFFESLSGSEGMKIFLGGTIVCIVSTFLSIFIGYKLFKIPYSLVLGFLSNQPAILDFATNMSNNKAPQIGYTMMFPIGIIVKILIAQLIFLSLS